MGHFTIYGGSYYSYLYARCLSSTIWRELLAPDPLDRGAGEVPTPTGLGLSLLGYSAVCTTRPYNRLAHVSRCPIADCQKLIMPSSQDLPFF
jgi:hypothetical protein